MAVLHDTGAMPAVGTRKAAMADTEYPGALLGHMKDGRPIYLAAGGAEDGDVQEEEDKASDSPPESGNKPDATDDGKDKPDLGDAGKKALAAERKARKDAEALVAKYRKAEEDRDLSSKSDLEQARAKLAAAEKLAEAAAARAVKAEVKAAAVDWADPADAPRYLDDLSKYINDGVIDEEAITADLAAVLEKKPHLKKTTEVVKPKPKPDPSQGNRGGQPARSSSLTEAVKKAIGA